ncbi:MAG: acetylglutamate kinase [Bacteroidota bacterium]
MDKPILHIIKIGGNVIDDDVILSTFLKQLNQLSEPFILVHGGGKLATGLSKTLGISAQLIDGRRITDAQTLDVVTMVYAGLINKKIVAQLQGNNLNAIGLCGADANIIQATKRNTIPIDFGFVGDVHPENISTDNLRVLLKNNMLPVVAPITHDGKGQLLNTNADTIASGIAIALSGSYNTKLYYCFEKKGVLSDVNDDNSWIPELSQKAYAELKTSETIHSGMIPKLDNAFAALNKEVNEVYILHALQFHFLNNTNHAGTKLVK